jgi:nucleoside-diphosphate-sugar epimerase
MIRAYPHLSEKSGSKIVFVPQEKIYGKSYEDIARRVPDITRMRTILGVEPKIPLVEGLRKTIDWFKHDFEKGAAASGGEGQA